MLDIMKIKLDFGILSYVIDLFQGYMGTFFLLTGT